MVLNERKSRKTGKTKSYSLDSKRVLGVLYERGFATEFIENYIEHKSWSAKCSKLQTILDSCTEEAGISKYGKKLYKLPFSASLETNRRFNYHNFDIISQIPKTMTNCISVEDGYFLAWGDFAQSDFLLQQFHLSQQMQGIAPIRHSRRSEQNPAKRYRA